jgi:methylenetetrahydrofolate dehydrogenase (NADP+)/methenyltetrahydrofolate cyclohydrolase
MLLNGDVVAEKILREVQDGIWLKNHQGFLIRPALAVILTTDEPASRLYVQKKRQACEKVGINSVLYQPFENGVEKFSDPESHLLGMIEWLNKDKAIHGILVQLPLPVGVYKSKVFDTLNPIKDVDVFSPTNVGLLTQGRPRYQPCTPAAVQAILHHYGHKLEGKKVTLINRSDVVGKPLFSMMVRDDVFGNATVSMCHDKTPEELLIQCCQSSDFIVVAVGQPNFLKVEMVNKDSVIVDVGINRVDGKVVGDCDPAVYNIVKAYTPVPGGVGPVTVAMLMKNTFLACCNQL